MKAAYKIYFHLFFVLIFFYSCKEENKDISAKEKISNKIKSFETRVYNNKAIILKNKIQIFDTNLNVIQKIEDCMGTIVTIDSISERKYNIYNTNNRCDLHNFIWINSEKFFGWTYGQYIFEKEKSNKIYEYEIDEIPFYFIPTKNFNIGVYDKDLEELSFCNKNQNPILFYNGLYQKYEYLPLKNENILYPEGYFTIDNHERWTDEILSFDYNDETIFLSVLREYQDSSLLIDIEIKIKEKQSFINTIKSRTTSL